MCKNSVISRLLVEKIKLEHEGEHFPVFDAAGQLMHIIPDGGITFCQGVHVPCYSECVFLFCGPGAVAMVGTSSLVVMNVGYSVSCAGWFLCDIGMHVRA